MATKALVFGFALTTPATSTTQCTAGDKLENAWHAAAPVQLE
jgi:hypothetical protein